MPEFLILLLLQVTLFSSVTALMLIAVKQIFKCRIPPLIGTVMWVILLARLLCPIFPESSISVYNFIPVGKDLMFTLTYNVGEGLAEQETARLERENPYVLRELSEEETGLSVSSENVSGGTSGHSSYERHSGERVAESVPETEPQMVYIAVLAVYLLGIAGFLTYHISLYSRAKRVAMMMSVPCEDERLLAIYYKSAEAAGIPYERLPDLRVGMSSMVIGCVKPCVICREGTEEREAGMMFAHELIHFKHHDNALLLFSTVIVCFYWYNPLIWLVRAMLREDIEVLCDARTLEECGIVGTDYAMMLCRNSAFGELASAAGCAMSASGRHLKTRLRTISLRKRRNVFVRAGSVLLCAVIMLLCLTNPIVSQSSDYSTYIRHYATLTGEDERAMHLTSRVTVSVYLGQLGDILTDKAEAEVWNAVGGNLEKFKRTCEASGLFSENIKREVRNLKTDEILTNQNCALISNCVATLLSNGTDIGREGVLLLPDVIPVATMQRLLEHLTENEANAVLSCYNRGVNGADVRFERVYSSAMMELILSRINDEWLRHKFDGFYHKIESDGLADYAMSAEMRAMVEVIGTEQDFYLCDPNITAAEEAILRNILRTASAGENEDVYYRKDAEDGCDWNTAAFLFYRAGYTYEDMFCDRAEIGESAADVTVGGVAYLRMRDSRNVPVSGTSTAGVREALADAYEYGFIDAEAGVIDPGKRLSCGESLASAYRVVYSAIARTVS